VSRRRARKQAFLTLYQSDVTGVTLDSILARWRHYKGDLEEYAETLARGVERDRPNLDGRIGEAAEGWKVDRMNAVDRTIMRLAMYEMLYTEDVPTDVAVNEAIELAKGFSSEEAPGFVGGVLRGAGRELIGS